MKDAILPLHPKRLVMPIHGVPHPKTLTPLLVATVIGRQAVEEYHVIIGAQRVNHSQLPLRLRLVNHLFKRAP